MSENDSILIISQNLFFLPRVQNVAEPLGCDVRQIRTEAEYVEAFEQQAPALVLVDLEGDPDTWHGIVENTRSKPDVKTRIIAYGPHSDTEGFAKATALGCDAVLSKGQFTRDLPKIIETRGALNPS